MMMPNVDIAARVYNHRWKIYPIVRSLLDTDFYKLLMCQSVFRNKPDTNVTFQLINRSKSIRLADIIDEVELREQLDQTPPLTEEEREHLHDLMAQIESEIKLEQSTQENSIADGVNLAVERFELEHPTIAGALRNIATTLHSMGI